MENEILINWSEDIDGKYQEAADFAENFDNASTIVATNEKVENVQRMGFVIPTGLNLRAEPHKYAEVLRVLEKNTPVFMPLTKNPKRAGVWVEVTTVDEVKGYVVNEYIDWV